MRRSPAARSSTLSVLMGLPAVALLAACGGNLSSVFDNGAQSGSSGNVASGIVSVQQVASFGPMLEDSKGNTVYYNDKEIGSTFKCTQACLGFWYPVPASANPGNVPGVGTVQRPDNHQQQLTYQGHPLYTFRLDATGQRNGDNLSDDFAGTHFTWHAATTGPVTSPPSSKTLANSGITIFSAPNSASSSPSPNPSTSPTTNPGSGGNPSPSTGTSGY
jgi:predicted lipoprotein with Yx(FWY)xxD motif